MIEITARPYLYHHSLCRFQIVTNQELKRCFIQTKWVTVLFITFEVENKVLFSYLKKNYSKDRIFIKEISIEEVKKQRNMLKLFML